MATEMNRELSATLFPGQTLYIRVKIVRTSRRYSGKLLTYDRSQKLLEKDQAPASPLDTVQVSDKLGLRTHRDRETFACSELIVSAFDEDA